MNCWEYYSRTLSTILWSDAPAVQPVRDRVEHLIRSCDLGIDSRDLPRRSPVPPELEHAGTIVVRPGKSSDFGICPGTRVHRCCNYLTLNVYAGCTLGCTYCIMQSYLRNRTLEIFVPPEEQLQRIDTLARSHPDRVVRLGTGEVGDSLLYDPLFGLSGMLVERFREIGNIRFELKTKTDYVDHLPAAVSGHDTSTLVLGFSLNPQHLVDTEEGWAATLEERLAAARRGWARGYRPAFHFDPLILHEHWRDAYGAVADRLREFRSADPAWISLGTLRYPPTLRSAIERRPYAWEEFVPGADGKFRYLQPVRAEMYRFMRDRLREALPDTPVYLCMESATVWRNFLDFPRKDADGSGRRSRVAGLRPIMMPVLARPGADDAIQENNGQEDRGHTGVE